MSELRYKMWRRKGEKKAQNIVVITQRLAFYGMHIQPTDFQKKKGKKVIDPSIHTSRSKQYYRAMF